MKAAALSSLMQEKPEWASNLILAGLRGSDAHGTKLPEGHPRATDDVDTFGVAVRPMDWYLGLPGYFNTRSHLTWATDGEHFDHLVYDVRKFFALLVRGNPNVHAWLWTDADDILFKTTAGALLLKHRQMFLSQRCIRALVGYAYDQFKRMERKRYAGYQGAKRKALVDELGYDVKHAAHVVRLLNMGADLATTGCLRVRRPEAEAKMLREIKAGEWSFAEVRERIALSQEEFDDAQITNALPEEPDVDAINRMLVNIIRLADLAPDSDMQ